MKGLSISDGTIEALKWFALILMFLDHYNKFIYQGALPFLFEAGRLCVPIFAFVIGHNLARQKRVNDGAYIRVISRLVIFGLAATPAFFAMSQWWWPLNIMFMFIVSVLCIFLIHSGGKVNLALACCVFLFGGLLVEWWWWGIILCISSWFYCRKPGIYPLMIFVFSTASLAVINQNYYALAALPILYFSQFIDIPIPRLKYAFYVFYPAHLSLIWAIKTTF